MRYLALVLVACSSAPESEVAVADSAAAVDSTEATETTAPDTFVEDTSVAIDSAVADEGAPDAARDFGSDRTKFFGASRCSTAKVQLCEDFESGTLDTKTWTVVGTAPTIEGAEHARGSKALHVKRVGNGNSYIRETKTFPAISNRYWGRIFLRFATLPGAPMTYSHWTFAAATGTKVAGEIRLGGQLSSGKNLFGVGTDNRSEPTGTGDWTNSDKDPGGMPRTVPTGEWMCIEWVHDGEKNETKFFWDGVEHPSLATTTTKHGGNTNPYILPEFNALWIGWAEYQTSTLTFDLWVDEIAIDSARIGCVL
jgi:hypothetical protein